MEPPVAAEVETKSDQTDETKGSSKSYECGLCDTEVVYKIAQELLPGLASACVDNTTGGIFKSAGSVAVDMRKEMADYLTQRSETYVAEFLLAENTSGLELSEHPYDILLTLIDDFSASKRNMFSRVSEWVLSDRREDRIDDFVQEMEINGFWLLARREYIATMLLKNVDYKNEFHCNMVCNSEEEVVAHRSGCKFRPIDCTNEGCTTRYCAAQKEHHEAVCPFMILPCEQKCSDFVMRREMDRHCVTICPMKLVNCAFYTVGCESSIPRCNVQQHNADDLSSHLLYIIRTAHKEANDEDLKHRVEQIRNLSNTEKLARARDARALTYLIKDAEAKLGPLEVKTKPHDSESPESPSHMDNNNKKESPIKTEPLSTGHPSVVKDGSDSATQKEEHPVSTETKVETESPTKEVNPKSPTNVESAAMTHRSDSPIKTEERKDKEESSMEEEDESAMKKEGPQIEGTTEEQTTKSPGGEKVEKESSNTMGEEPIKSTTKETISRRNEQESEKSTVEEKSKQLSGSDEKESKKPPVEEKSKQLSGSDEEDTKKLPGKETKKESSGGNEEDSTRSPKKETAETSPRHEEEEEESPNVKTR